MRISLLPYKAVRGELFLEGYIRGAEAVALRPWSASARDGEGRVDTRAGSRDTEVAGLGCRTGLRPSPWCLAEPRAPGDGAPRRGGGRVSRLWRGRGRSGAGSPECGDGMPPRGGAGRETGGEAVGLEGMTVPTPPLC